LIDLGEVQPQTSRHESAALDERQLGGVSEAAPCRAERALKSFSRGGLEVASQDTRACSVVGKAMFEDVVRTFIRVIGTAIVQPK